MIPVWFERIPEIPDNSQWLKRFKFKGRELDLYIETGDFGKDYLVVIFAEYQDRAYRLFTAPTLQLIIEQVENEMTKETE